jgi:hypothetical protein
VRTRGVVSIRIRPSRSSLCSAMHAMRLGMIDHPLPARARLRGDGAIGPRKGTPVTETNNSPDRETGKVRRLHSLEWRLTAPVPIFVLLAIVLVWIVVSRVIAANATEDAIRMGQQVAAQFKVIRGYYTDNIVNKAVKSGALKPSFNHKSDDGAIPLPATMIQDLSALFADKDTTISLYSRYPFPNRKDRQLDAFQSEAWDFLSANPTATFSRDDVRNGRHVMRVAIADTMTV